MQNGNEASPIIISASLVILVKMVITLEPHGTFDHILHNNTF